MPVVVEKIHHEGFRRHAISPTPAANDPAHFKASRFRQNGEPSSRSVALTVLCLRRDLEHSCASTTVSFAEAARRPVPIFLPSATAFRLRPRLPSSLGSAAHAAAAVSKEKCVDHPPPVPKNHHTSTYVRFNLCG
eukprot:CAMPEP_0171935334 /NCGR_PEP_ID=MMETSP0993-20121228/32809_1 /TAXON_ID=483369 /ORGANISM="non described non described, Strain CCMP2098" /LENGTH=134 /DNA_ID=CAMNT_0012576233 /DNA_START=162 /DNA_END=566 /DNA_ORIENTATION=-